MQSYEFMKPYISTTFHACAHAGINKKPLNPIQIKNELNCQTAILYTNFQTQNKSEQPKQTLCY